MPIEEQFHVYRGFFNSRPVSFRHSTRIVYGPGQHLAELARMANLKVWQKRHWIFKIIRSGIHLVQVKGKDRLGKEIPNKSTSTQNQNFEEESFFSISFNLSLIQRKRKDIYQCYKQRLMCNTVSHTASKNHAHAQFPLQD